MGERFKTSEKPDLDLISKLETSQNLKIDEIIDYIRSGNLREIIELGQFSLDEKIISQIVEKEKDKSLFLRYSYLVRDLRFSKEDIELIIENNSLEKEVLYRLVHANADKIDELPDEMIENFLKSNDVDFLISNGFVEINKELFLKLLHLAGKSVGALEIYIPKFEGHLDIEVANLLIEKGFRHIVEKYKRYFQGLSNVEFVDFRK